MARFSLQGVPILAQFRGLKPASDRLWNSGLTESDRVWISAQDHSGREKLAAEMKKELKRLQRLRDQVRGWASMVAPVLDQRLTDARAAVETEMERFRELEKLLKIRTFSKAGLQMVRLPMWLPTWHGRHGKLWFGRLCSEAGSGYAGPCSSRQAWSVLLQMAAPAVAENGIVALEACCA